MYSTNVPRFFVSIFSRRTGTNNMQISVLLDFSHTGELILFARNVFTFVVIDADMFFQNICDFFLYDDIVCLCVVICAIALNRHIL